MEYKIDIGLEGAKEEIVDLSKELLVLRLAFGKLKATIRDAFAPITAAVVQALQKAVFWAIRLVKNVGQVIAALFGVKTAQDAVTKSVAKASKAVKASVAGFDQLERLNGSGGGGYVTAVSVAEDPQLPANLAAIVERIMTLLAPLREIDFLPLQWNLARLGDSFTGLKEQIGQAMQWVWFAVLTPFAAWVVEKLAPVFTGSLKAAIDTVSAALTPLGEGFDALWQALQPVISFVGDTVLVVFDQLRRLFVNLAAAITEKGEKITGIFRNIGTCVTALWQAVLPVLTQLRTLWALTFEDMGKILSRVVGFLIDSLHGLTEFLAGAFTGDWSRAWNGIKEMLKGSVNGVIGLLNMLLTGLTAAVNGVVKVINKLSFTAPDWVPGLGGKTFGFNLKTVATPQIPYLARGAVLPANKPFLAMVGDQRHGTNIEAPLETIQQAVAVVLDQQLSALMAGFDATVGEIRSLHDTVSSIEVGDSVIGKAAARYQRKMAVVNGRPY